VLFDLVHPVFNGREAITVGYIIGNDDAVGSLVVAASYGFEAFLTSGVPLEVQVNGLLIKEEIDQNSGMKEIDLQSRA